MFFENGRKIFGSFGSLGYAGTKKRIFFIKKYRLYFLLFWRERERGRERERERENDDEEIHCMITITTSE